MTTVVETPAGWARRPGARVFSGHESFACRYGWLPKLHEAVTGDPALFSSDERAILTLGLGRNMVKSLRFWGEAFGLTRQAGGEVRPTDLAKRLLAPEGGLDRYLETPGALWRLHWVLATHGGLGAWAVTFLDLHDQDIPRDRLVNAVMRKAEAVRGSITTQTAGVHVDMLVRTYAATTDVDATADDILGSPFQELGLIRMVEPAGVKTLRLQRGPKPSIDVAALAFVLHDFWGGTAPTSRTLSMRSMMLSHAAPGSTLQLDEAGLHDRLDALCAASRTLTLRPDGAGGLDLTASRDPIAELEKMAW
ncbi:hypothetical protein ACVWZA_000541 [Sphingomonas sp. UYAg733]